MTVKGPGSPSFDIATFTIKELLVDDEVKASFTKRLMQASPYVLPAGEAAALLEAREIELVQIAGAWRLPPPAPEDDGGDSFLG